MAETFRGIGTLNHFLAFVRSDLHGRGVVTRTGKHAFYAQLEMPLEAAYAYAAKVMTENMLHAEAHEGIGAFLEKREPKWPE